MVTWRVWEHVLCLWPTPCSPTRHPRLSLNKGSPGGGSPYTRARHCWGRHIGINKFPKIFKVLGHKNKKAHQERCIDLILGPLNTVTYRLSKNLPPPPTPKDCKNNLQHPVVFKTTRLQTLPPSPSALVPRARVPVLAIQGPDVRV